jgi:hypothetical protein
MEKQEPFSPDQEPIPGKGQELPSAPGQDQAWQRVYFGQVAGPLVPPHPGPPESPEEELTRAALEDPGAAVREMSNTRPTFWRVVVLIVLAVTALAIVFWRR